MLVCIWLSLRTTRPPFATHDPPPTTTHHPPSRDFKKAEAYRDAEVPFLVYNVPEAEDVVSKWNREGYLEKLLGDER